MLTISNCIFTTNSTAPCIQLDTLPSVTEDIPQYCGCDECKQQESDMQVAVNTQHDEARYHLLSRLGGIYWDKDDELELQFHTKRKNPKNVKEAKEWLAKGYYTFTDETSEDELYPYWKEYFKWGTEKADHEGYRTAKEALGKAKQAAEDIIMVKTDEDARLQALNDFQSWAYTN